MSTTVKPHSTSNVHRRSSFLETESTSKSAMILTSAQSQRGVSRGGQGHADFYENSYKLEPEQKACSTRMQKVVKVTLEEHLTGRKYNPEDAGDLSRTISEQIKQRAKKLGLPRYKFVCMVSIGPQDNATIAMTSRCVWNTKVDTYAEHVFENASIYAVGVLYGIYFE